jgi:hypothetical protein
MANRRLSSGAQAAADMLARKMEKSKKALENNVDLSDSEDEIAPDANGGAGAQAQAPRAETTVREIKKLAKSINGAWKRKASDEADLKAAEKKKKLKEAQESGKKAAQHPASAVIGDQLFEEEDDDDEPNLGKNNCLLVGLTINLH